MKKAAVKKHLFNIFILGSIAACLTLGFWQIERMKWKEGLIAQVQKYENERPVEFKFDEYDPQNNLFQKIFMNGKFLHEQEMLISAKYFSEERDKNQLGFHVITPFLTTEGVIIFVNRGWIPDKYKEKSSRPDSLIETNIETTIEGLVRESKGKAPWYMPKNYPQDNVWFWIDLPAMIKRLKDVTDWQNIRPVLIQQTNLTTVNNFKYPIPVSGHLEFYNQHLSYVITWFSLAAIIFVMWVIYLRKEKKTQQDR